MKKLLLTLALVLVPSFTFAATDDQIKASLTQQLLSMFVVQVNSLDKMQTLVKQSSNPSQFDAFSGIVAAQLSQTTAQLAELLNPSSASNNGWYSKTSLSSTDKQTTEIPLAGSSIQSCATEPVIDLSIATTSLEKVNFASIIRHIQVNGNYRTDCSVSDTTKYSFVFSLNGKNIAEDEGMLRLWNVNIPNYSYTTQLFNLETAAPFQGGTVANYNYKNKNDTPLIIKLTIGTASTTISVPASN